LERQLIEQLRKML